ncbi:MAG: nickel ABC transporter permease subunit NikB [Pseudomonadota bacterium]
MFKYVLRRMLILIPLLLVVSLLVFLTLRMGENDPAMSYLRLSQLPPTDEALAHAREQLGLNRPVAVQYFDWLGKALRLDFGVSYVTGAPVTERLLYYLPNTLYLGGVSLVLTLLLSFPLGIYSALKKDRWPDQAVRALSYVGVSTPSFWLGFLLVFVFSVKLGWLPPLGKGGLSHVIMPALTLSLMSMCINTRLIRGSMLEQMFTRSVLYARIRGVPEKWVIGRHVMKNSLIPVVTAVGMHIGEMIGGSVVVEMIFAWPGVGRYAVSAIFNRDFPVMQCFILMMTALFVICNLGVDILYAWLDPRIRYEGGSTK